MSNTFCRSHAISCPRFAETRYLNRGHPSLDPKECVSNQIPSAREYPRYLIFGSASGAEPSIPTQWGNKVPSQGEAFLTLNCVTQFVRVVMSSHQIGTMVRPCCHIVSTLHRLDNGAQYVVHRCSNPLPWHCTSEDDTIRMDPRHAIRRDHQELSLSTVHVSPQH
jgi:hypothetical protein